MKKTWSITTTLRNPVRLRDFLLVLKEVQGENWDRDCQCKYQILLIKNRIYGFGSKQFYNGLTTEQVNLIDDPKQALSFEQAKIIFEGKDYKDPAMRGRQSINPLKKLGLVVIKNDKIYITDLGKLLLKEDYDLGEIFFRSFIKWQLPNPDNNDYKKEDGYDIKPFIGTLHLIEAVNKKMKENGDDPKGISKQEFSLFVPTLVNYNDINSYANQIITLRQNQKNKEKREQKEIFENFKISFAGNFLGTNNGGEINKLLKNLKDYGDNAIRYFRMTRYIYIRGGGFYIDLEQRRQVEIENLLNFDNGKSLSFENAEDYSDFIANIQEPTLPWETVAKFLEIVRKLLLEIEYYEDLTGVTRKVFSNYETFSREKLKEFAEELREYRRQLQEKQNHIISQDVESVTKYIDVLKNIRKAEDRPVTLEKYTALALHALNDALRIQPNYPVGDDNEPTFTAPAGRPDIECFYTSFNAICEVTMLTSRDQWFNEGQPVMRHLRDFEDKNNDKKAYCLFVAPSLHRDTLNTFWTSVKYEYEGRPQKIVPLSIHNFVELLKTLVTMKQKGVFLSHSELTRLYDDILAASNTAQNVIEWVDSIPQVISSWQRSLTV